MSKTTPDPYVAVALQPSFKGAHTRQDIMTNIESIAITMRASMWLSAELPVRMMTLPEGVLQGFNDEFDDRNQAEFARTMAIDIPGPETDALGKLAKEHNVYLVAQAKATHSDFSGYFFNTAFILSPEGDVIHQAPKNIVATIEGSATPHDVYDRWVELYGDNSEAFFPVCDSPIGRIGTMICYEGMFPEPARALALNGAEIIYHPSAAVNSTDMGAFELVNRARAFDNNCYVVAPNSGLYHYSDASLDPIDLTGGNSMVVDYRGRVIGKHAPNTNSWAAGVIDIGALRHFRAEGRMRNWLKELRTELFQTIYDNPIYEKNLYNDKQDKNFAERIKWMEMGAKRLKRD
jgi:predicted amidohydrolase